MKFWKHLTALLLVLCLLPVAAGCSPAVAGDLMVDVQAAESPSVPAEPDTAFVSAVGDFNWQLLRKSAGNGDNLLLSPASVYLALAMTLNGAAGETREAMLAALSSQGLTLDEINAASRDWVALLTNTSQKTLLSVANSIWYRDGFDAAPAFLQSNADYFAAAARTLDFSDPSAPGVINGWVKDATGGNIDKIVDKIDPAVVMYLINAVHFKAEWQNPFEAALTVEQTFRTSGGDVTASFMHQTGGMDYLSSDDCQGVLLPYTDGRFAFFALLPADGATPRDLIEEMDAAAFGSLLTSRNTESIELSLPKFTARYEDSLINELTALGMGVAFSGGEADFSLMNAGGRADLVISEVRHKTFCRVDEKGTEAAAVTSVEIQETAMPVGEISLVFDRPFLYGIVDTVTGLPLFLGVLDDPTAS